MSVLDARTPGTDYAPLLNKSYQDAGIGREIVDWLAWMELGGLAPATLDQYERDLARAALAFPSKGISEWTDGDLMLVVRLWPQKSRRVRKAALDSFFKWAKQTRRIHENPMDLVPQVKRQPRKVIDTFTEAERERLLGLPLIDGALMGVMLLAGLRKSECRNLRVRDLRFDAQPQPKIIVLQGKGGKDRVVWMVTRLSGLLTDLLLTEGVGQGDYLWYDKPGGGRATYSSPRGHARRVKPVGSTSFQRWWVRCLEEAEVPYRNPHTTRHTFATEWLRRRGPLHTLSLAMGHASIQTTHDLYAHLDAADVVEDFALMESM